MMEEKVSSALSQEDKDTINKQVESGLEWLSQNPSADVDVYESKQKEGGFQRGLNEGRLGIKLHSK